VNIVVDFENWVALWVRDLAVRVLHLPATVARLAGPAGARSVVPNPLSSAKTPAGSRMWQGYGVCRSDRMPSGPCETV